MAGPLDTELETFEKHREQLLAKAEGKYALIHKRKVVGIFETEAAAIAHGYKHLGPVPFLVKQILQVETPVTFVSGLLGI